MRGAGAVEFQPGAQIYRTARHARRELGRGTDEFSSRLKIMNATAPANLNLVLDVPVSLTIELGSCQLPMKEVLQLNIGSVVQLDKPADAPVELSVNGKLIARGEVVVVEDRFGVKITEVVGSANALAA
jgi:flagellar motor switch protein FliN/FliY